MIGTINNIVTKVVDTVRAPLSSLTPKRTARNAVPVKTVKQAKARKAKKTRRK